MTRKKLKDWVIPTLGIIVLIGALILYYILGRVLNYDLVPEDTYVTDALIDNTIEVQQEIESSISKPYNSQDVKISKYFYLEEDEESKQQQSLIRYENIYMPNTGILYSSSKEFDIISILDGKVTSVKEDEILGNIVEIEHSNNIVSIYQSIKDVQVKIGDQVKQGDVIAKSGSNKLENEQDNCLHFELYKDGTLINPEELYNG